MLSLGWDAVFEHIDLNDQFTDWIVFSTHPLGKFEKYFKFQ
jgi:hypothetical protein